ncbi:MAG: septal ring lytic transglycosylase RlpA family protein [Bacteroidales bacterium]
MKLLIGIIPLFLLVQTTLAQVGFKQEGMASYYADDFEGKTTASGERFSHKKATCAHMSIPFGALVKITNLENNQTVIVRVNDRGPFVPDRIIDVSQSVAQRLGILGKGAVKVSLEVVDNSGFSIQKEDSTKQSEQIVDNTEKKEQPKVEKVTSTENKTVEKIEGKPEEVKSDCELFSVKIESIELKGFSIQIGSYKELANILRVAADVQKATKNDTKIQVVSVNGEKVYRLMVGLFSSRTEADDLKAKIAKIYKDCFVVELKK